MTALLVTGASGRLGRRVVELLLARDTGRPIIATTRTPGALADLARRGVEVRYADHRDPAGLVDALRGAERMLAISSFDIGRRGAQIANLVAAAAAAGVSHLCYTSAAGAGADPVADPVTADHRHSERAITESGLDWTLLRHNMYAEHVPLTLAVGVASGLFCSPIGAGGRAYVTREDCARADAGALAAAPEGNRVVEVSGPALVTHAALAAIATRLTGRPVAFRAVDRAAAIAHWTRHGIPAPIAAMVADYDLFAGEGHHSAVTTAVRDLGGAAPEPVEALLARHPDWLRPGAAGRARVDELLAL